MNKVKQFITKSRELFNSLKGKIFKRQIEEQQAKQKQKIILIIVVALVVIGVGWLLVSKLWLQPKSDSSATKPLAEAKITIVGASSCGKTCWDTKLFVDALTTQNIKIVSQKKYSVGGWWPFNKADNLVKAYQITKLPTVIIEFTGKDKPDITKFFGPNLGAVINNKFVLTKTLAPYYDVASKQIKGNIKVTYLTDKSCAECYDIKKHEIALKNLGVDASNSASIDISSAEGKAMVNQYKITKAPTVIISGEVSEYAVLSEAWSQVGVIATDGAYVFTAVDLMGDSYRDLTSGKVIKATDPNTAPAPAVPATKK